MPSREIINPQWDVAIEEDMVNLKFWVPGSRFGLLDVKFEPGTADDLAKHILRAHVLIEEEA